MPSDNRTVEVHTQYASEAAVIYCFDFTNFPEVLSGQTISTPVMPAVSGVTFGTPTITAATFTQYNPNGTTSTVAAGKGVLVAITIAAAGVYTIDCTVVPSGGGKLARRVIFEV